MDEKLGIVYIWLKLGRRLLYPLSKIGRRIRKMLDTFCTALGVLAFSGSVAIFAVVAEFRDRFPVHSPMFTGLMVTGMVLGLFGVFLLALVLISLVGKQKRKDLEREYFKKLVHGIANDLKGLRQDLTQGGDKNGRNKNNPV